MDCKDHNKPLEYCSGCLDMVWDQYRELGNTLRSQLAAREAQLKDAEEIYKAAWMFQHYRHGLDKGEHGFSRKIYDNLSNLLDEKIDNYRAQYGKVE